MIKPRILWKNYYVNTGYTFVKLKKLPYFDTSGIWKFYGLKTHQTSLLSTNYLHVLSQNTLTDKITINSSFEHNIYTKKSGITNRYTNLRTGEIIYKFSPVRVGLIGLVAILIFNNCRSE